MHRNLSITETSLVSPALYMKQLLEMLSSRAGVYEGIGLNDHHQFNGRIEIIPVVGDYGININYKAEGIDNDVFQIEHNIIALNNENKITLYTLNNKFNTMLMFEFRHHKRIHGEKDILIFGFGDATDKFIFREEISIELWDNGNISYNYFWGHPTGDFLARSNIMLSKVS
jgi:hypothetical protein